MSGKPTVLVDINSATHGRPWDIGAHCVLAINRCHSNLVKFSKQDEVYEVVLLHLQRFSSVAMDVVRERFKINSANSRCSYHESKEMIIQYSFSSIITGSGAGSTGWVF